MSIKAVIDAGRSAAGYAGMAVFICDEPIFTEQLDAAYVSCLCRLHKRVCGEARGASESCSIASGFTFHVWAPEGFTVVLRLSGRFSPKPPIALTQPDYIEPLQPGGLPAREDLRKEAEALLRQYDLL